MLYSIQNDKHKNDLVYDNLNSTMNEWKAKQSRDHSLSSGIEIDKRKSGLKSIRIFWDINSISFSIRHFHKHIPNIYSAYVSSIHYSAIYARIT